MLFQQREDLAREAQVEHRVLRSAAAQHLHLERGAGGRVAERQRRARLRRLAGPDVRPGLAGRQHALDQHLDATARGLGAEQARLDHAGVVEHEQVARVQQAGQLAEDAVDERVGRAIEQARTAAFGRRMLRDQVVRQLEVEVAEAMVAGWRR